MTNPAAPTSDTFAPDAARAVLARQIDILGELADLALEFTRAIKDQALDEAEPGKAADSALAFNRAAKAVRQTLMLQAELLKQGQQASKVESPAVARIYRPDRVAEHKDRLERIIDRIAEREGRDPDGLEGFHEAAERLDDEDLYDDILSRPISELVAEICQDLGLNPDWPVLAEEAWARREVESGAVGWPLTDVAACSSSEKHPPPEPTPRSPSPLVGEGVSAADG